MVNRKLRNELINLIDQYLAGSIKAFEFDRRLQALDSRNDATVREIIFNLWLFYDDLIDHPVNLSKEAWDWVQRQQLLLHSNKELSTRRIWRWPQLAALLAITFLAYEAWAGGVTDFKLAYLKVGVGFAVWMFFHQYIMDNDEQNKTLAPFTSLASIRRVRKSLQNFRKQRHPAGPPAPPLRSETATFLHTISGFLAAILMGPLALPFILLPRKEATVSRE